MSRQRGNALLVTLVALGVMVVAGFALLRSSTTVSAIVGNTATKQAAVEAADTAVQAAVARLGAITDPEAAIAGAYFPTEQATDSNGLPLTDWATIPVVQTGGFRLQYLIDRLCGAPLPVVDAAVQCSIAPATSQTASNRVGSPVYTLAPPTYYRVTVRVLGPKSSESYVQAILSK